MIGMPNRGSMHAIVAGRIGMTLQPCNIAFSYQLPRRRSSTVAVLIPSLSVSVNLGRLRA